MMLATHFTRNMTKRYRQWLTAILLGSCLVSPAFAEFIWAPDQPVGSTLSSFELPDDTGQPQKLDALYGERGMLLMFSRSADW